MSSLEINSTPRTAYSSASSIAMFSRSSAKQYSKRPQVRICARKFSHLRALPTMSSSIHLPTKSFGSIKTSLLLKNARSNYKTSSFSTSRCSTVSNKHTLEIKFINTNKCYFQLKKKLVDKQKPIVPLYKSLLGTKEKLEKSDKLVALKDIKLVPCEGLDEQVPLELLRETGSSVQVTPRTLAKVCRNLLNKKALVVEHLDKVAKSEVDIGDVAGRVESLKSEGQRLQEPLEAILTKHEDKIKNLVPNWESLLNIKQSSNKASALELKLQEENKDASKSSRRLISMDCMKYIETTQQLVKQQECITRYEMMLQVNKNKLKDKTNTVSNLQNEIMQLQIRQHVLADQNNTCPTYQLQRIIEESRLKLNDLIQRSIENEQEFEYNANVIEQQIQQMSQMKNLLRHQGNMVAELTLSKDELILYNESLARNSQEMRAELKEVTQEGKMKNRLIIKLQEKIDLKERQITNLENNIKALEANLMMTNEKRFMLQLAVEFRGKDLQNAKTHFNQLTDINQRNGIHRFWNLF